MKEHGRALLGVRQPSPTPPDAQKAPLRGLRSNRFYFMELKTIACLGNARIWPTSPL